MKNIHLEGQVPRTALVRRMKKASAKNNIFLTAPGGYGKTTAVTQWLHAVKGKTARMTASHADNNPSIFYKHLASMLTLLTGVGEELGAADVTFNRLLEVVSALPEKSERVYFALDDLHMITNEEIHSNRLVFIERLPEGIIEDRA